MAEQESIYNFIFKDDETYNEENNKSILEHIEKYKTELLDRMVRNCYDSFIIENKLPGCLCLSSSKMEFLKNTVDEGIKNIISSNGSKIISISITNLVDEVDFTYSLSINKIKLMLDCIKFGISF